MSTRAGRSVQPILMMVLGGLAACSPGAGGTPVRDAAGAAGARGNADAAGGDGGGGAAGSDQAGGTGGETNPPNDGGEPEASARDARGERDTPPSTGGADGGAPDGPPGSRRAVVAVGYGGVRVLSLDDGLTWTKTGEDQPNGGDDKNLLRAVAYGNGLWVAGGWDRWFTAPDGKTWTLRPHTLGIVQGMAFGNGFFLASLIDGPVYRSNDGLTWTLLGDPGTGKHTELVFGNGQFAAYGADSGVVKTSVDGVTWTTLPALTSAAYCGGDGFKTVQGCYLSDGPGIWIPGIFLRADWLGKMMRSTDGKTFKQVWVYPQNAFDQLSFGSVP